LGAASGVNGKVVVEAAGTAPLPFELPAGADFDEPEHGRRAAGCTSETALA